MVSLKHKFTSPKSDGADSTLVRPSSWNDEHDLKTAADNVVLGRAAGAGAGPVVELAMGWNGSLRVSASTEWALASSPAYGLPFDRVDINVAAGTYNSATHVWTPPVNTTWRIGVNLAATYSGGDYSQLVLVDHAGNTMGATHGIADLSASIFAEDIYHFTGSVAVQWTVSVGGSGVFNFNNSYMITARVA